MAPCSILLHSWLQQLQRLAVSSTFGSRESHSNVAMILAPDEGSNARNAIVLQWTPPGQHERNVRSGLSGWSCRGVFNLAAQTLIFLTPFLLHEARAWDER